MHRIQPLFRKAREWLHDHRELALVAGIALLVLGLLIGADYGVNAFAHRVVEHARSVYRQRQAPAHLTALPQKKPLPPKENILVVQKGSGGPAPSAVPLDVAKAHAKPVEAPNAPIRLNPPPAEKRKSTLGPLEAAPPNREAPVPTGLVNQHALVESL